MELSGDARVYLVVNTVDYFGDARWSVQDFMYNELPGVGFNGEDMEKISRLMIGGTANEFDEDGVVVVRIA